jgi:hypothetical protein
MEKLGFVTLLHTQAGIPPALKIHLDCLFGVTTLPLPAPVQNPFEAMFWVSFKLLQE